jgi:hypothetical protein
MQVHIRDIDLERRQVDLDRALDIEITLENGQRFKVTERNGLLNIRTDEGRLVLIPVALNDVGIRQEPHF